MDNTNNNSANKITEYGFTQPQLLAIHDFLSWVQQVNGNSEGGSKIEALQMFKSAAYYGNKFYASYYYHGLRGGTFCSCIEYIEIDGQGTKTDLKTVYETVTPIVHKFEKLEQIKF